MLTPVARASANAAPSTADKANLVISSYLNIFQAQKTRLTRYLASGPREILTWIKIRERSVGKLTGSERRAAQCPKGQWAITNQRNLVAASRRRMPSNRGINGPFLLRPDQKIVNGWPWNKPDRLPLIRCVASTTRYAPALAAALPGQSVRADKAASGAPTPRGKNQ
jgi:hypothetical protein